MYLLSDFCIFRLGLHYFILFRIFYYVFWQRRLPKLNERIAFVGKFYFWRNFLDFFSFFFLMNFVFLLFLSFKKLIMISRGIFGIGRKPTLADLHAGKFSHYMEVKVELTANVSRIRWAFFLQNWNVLLFFPIKFQVKQINQEILEILQESCVKFGGWNILAQELEIVDHSQSVLSVVLVILAFICIFVGFMFSTLFFVFFGWLCVFIMV